jgi:alpha-ribazole phosphatase
MEIYLIRHTEAAVEKGICYGQCDVPLPGSSIESFEQIVRNLKINKPLVYSSPAKRCYHLAMHLKSCDQSINTIIVDPRLQEINFGEWEMKPWTELDQTVLNEWMNDFVSYQIPDGESFIQLHKRVSEFIMDLMNQNHNKPIVIITHAGVIRSFLCQVLGHPLNNAFRITVDFGSVSKITFSGENNCYSTVDFLNRSLV